MKIKFLIFNKNCYFILNNIKTSLNVEENDFQVMLKENSFFICWFKDERVREDEFNFKVRNNILFLEKK